MGCASWYYRISFHLSSLSSQPERDGILDYCRIGLLEPICAVQVKCRWMIIFLINPCLNVYKNGLRTSQFSVLYSRKNESFQAPPLDLIARKQVLKFSSSQELFYLKPVCLEDRNILSLIPQTIWSDMIPCQSKWYWRDKYGVPGGVGSCWNLIFMRKETSFLNR